MGTSRKSVVILVAAVAVAACGRGTSEMSDELRKDLELAGSTETLSLASSANASNQQVVSAIERTTPPAPRKVAPSQRAARHAPAPRATPQPVQTQRAEVSEELEVQPTVVASAPVEVAPTSLPRPTPVDFPSGAGMPQGRGAGADIGAIGGAIITVVLRGGGAGEDHCDPRYDGRRGRPNVPIAINSRIPVIQGTFPGRIAGMGSGRLRF